MINADDDPAGADKARRPVQAGGEAGRLFPYPHLVTTVGGGRGGGPIGEFDKAGSALIEDVQNQAGATFGEGTCGSVLFVRQRKPKQNDIAAFDKVPPALET